MRYSKETILQMHSLRSRGYSTVEISYLLKIPKTTVLRHTKNIKIRPQYLQRWLDRKKSSVMLKRKNLEITSKLASKLLSDDSKREPAIIASMLYWAEGTKKDFSLSNTDLNLIHTFISSLKKVFDLNNDDFTISVRIYQDINPKKSIDYWAKISGIELGKDTKINVLRGNKKGKLKYGMCRVRIKKRGDNT